MVNYHKSTDEVLFKRLIITVFIYVNIYSILYLAFSAKFAFVILFTTNWVLSPIVLTLDRLQFHKLSRFLFLLGTLVYILATGFGVRENMNAEYYYLATLLLPAFLFEPTDRRYLILGMFLCACAWGYHSWGYKPQLSEHWYSNDFPVEYFRIGNFVGTYVIMVIFIKFFTERYQARSEELEEAQSVSKIGNWSYDVKSKKYRWSKQMFKLFPFIQSRVAPTFDEHVSTIHPEDQSTWRGLFEKALQDGVRYKLRYRTIVPDGSVRWLEGIVEAKRDSNEKVIYLSGTCQDITDLVLADELIKMERSKAIQNSKLASLGEMSAGIAHEINNPLAIISGNISLIPILKNDPLMFEASLSSIEKATDRIVKIVGALKKFSRSDAKSVHSLHSVSEIIKEAMILTNAKSMRNHTKIDFESTSEGHILCNEIEIEQVLINLINNAIDAVKLVHEKWIKIILYDDNNSVVIQLKDSGHGISEHVQKKLFDPFFTTKPIGEGTGLGLSIVKGILDDHNATIEFLPNEKNTCFEIRFQKSEVSNAI